MYWKTELKQINNQYHEVICDSENYDIIAIVDILKKDFVNNIVNRHNESIKEAIREGVKIAKDSYEIVNNNINNNKGE